MRAALGLLAVLGLAAPVQAQLMLGWDFPRQENPTAFVLTATTDSGRILTWSIPVSPVGGCLAHPDPNLFCTKLLQCPAPGTARYVVRAMLDTEVSMPSNEIPCTTTLQAPCRCQEGPTLPTPQAPGVAGAPALDAPVATLTDTPPLEAVTPTTSTPTMQVPVDLTPAPMQEVAQVPQVQAMPGLPLFQPAQSRAPV